MPQKPIPHFIDPVELSPFVEKDVQVKKDILLKRTNDKEHFTLHKILSMLSFTLVGKNEEGELYIV